MSLHITVTKPYGFQGDVVSGEEVAHSKSLNSLKYEKKESTSLSSTPSSWRSIALFEDSQSLRAGPSDRSR